MCQYYILLTDSYHLYQIACLFSYFLSFFTGLSSPGAHNDGNITTFDDAFLAFLEKYNYKAGSIGVMIGGKLVHAKGFSLEEDSSLGSPLSVSPASSFSKTLTAAAILRLVEAGKLDLEQTVFCTQGILHELKPWNTTHMADPRVCDITVEHLLRHTSGWDVTKAPLFDPLLNQFYVSKGNDVPNIAGEAGAATPYHIIRFMLGRKLDFSPGAKSVYSNFDYSILGRVIVEVSGNSYEAYVKKAILSTCGMWHTRLGKRVSDKKDLTANEVASILSKEPKHTPGLYQSLGSFVIDSALGWHSNVFDIMRFMRCLDGSGVFKLLTSRSMKRMTKMPSIALVQQSDTWFGAGLLVKTSGELWVNGDHHTNDMIIHHSGFRRGERREQVSWVLLLDGKRHADLRHESRKLFRSVKKWPTEDLFISDLTDFRYDSNSKFPLIKLKLGEHHLNSFVNAAKFQKQKITWLAGHSSRGGTHFTVMTSRVDNHSELDYALESGLTKEGVERHRKKLKSFGYKLTQLQSYISRSHDSDERYACIFESFPGKQDWQIGLRVDHKQYQVIYEKLIHTGFMPKVQSVTSYQGYHVNYIFEKKTEKNFKSYIGVKLPELEDLVKTNAESSRGLVYLDATTHHDQPSFSAIFRHSRDMKPWGFHADLSERHLHKKVLDFKRKGLTPRIIVRIPSGEKQARYSVYFAEP